MMTSSINNKNNLKLQEERRSGAPYLLDPLPKRSAPPTRGTLNSSIILMEVKTMPLSLLMCLYMALYLYRICIVFVLFGLFLCCVFVSSTLFNRNFFPKQGNSRLVHHPLLWPTLFLEFCSTEQSPLEEEMYVS